MDRIDIEPNGPVAAVVHDLGNGDGARDVAGEDMATELITELQRPLDVDAIACLHRSQVGHVQGFADDIETDERAFDVRCGQAGAVVGHAGSELQPFGQRTHVDDESSHTIVGRDRHDLALSLNDSGEHQTEP